MNILEKIKLVIPKVSGIKYNNILLGKGSENPYPVKFQDKEVLIYGLTDFDELDKASINFFINSQNEVNLQQSTLDYSIFVETLKNLNKEYKLEKLLKSIEKELCKLLKSDGASIFIYNKEKNVLNFYITSGGASGKIENIDVPIDNSIAGYIYKENETFIFNDTEKTPFHFKKTDSSSGFKTINIIGTPIRYFEEVVGVLEAVNKDGGFVDEDLKIIEVFANMISNKLMNAKLYQEISETTKELILTFATAIDLRDKYTHSHSRNVTRYATSIAKELKMDDNFLEKMEIAALIHDIGKIGIPDEILNKTDKLTNEEFEVIKSHTIMGANMLRDVEFITDEILCGPLEHHEKLDGTGYPNGKKGEEISLIGKILSVSDIYDALTTERPYKKAWNYDDAIAFLRKDQDIKYAKYIIDALESYIAKIKNPL